MQAISAKQLGPRLDGLLRDDLNALRTVLGVLVSQDRSAPAAPPPPRAPACASVALVLMAWSGLPYCPPERSAVGRGRGAAGMHWEGRRSPPPGPSAYAQPLSPNAKCRLQRHL